MKNQSALIWLQVVIVLIAGYYPLSGQTPGERERILLSNDCKEVNRSKLAPVVLMQSNSPITFEAAKLIDCEGEGISLVISIRNRTINKAIKAYRLGIWFSNGNGSTFSKNLGGDAVISPSVESSAAYLLGKRNRGLNLNPSREFLGFVYILIIDVEFRDGTSYSEDKEFVDNIELAIARNPFPES